MALMSFYLTLLSIKLGSTALAVEISTICKYHKNTETLVITAIFYKIYHGDISLMSL